MLALVGVAFMLCGASSCVLQDVFYPAGGGPGRSQWWMIDTANPRYFFVVAKVPVLMFGTLSLAAAVGGAWWAAARVPRIQTRTVAGVALALGVMGGALGLLLFAITSFVAMYD